MDGDVSKGGANGARLYEVSLYQVRHKSATLLIVVFLIRFLVDVMMRQETTGNGYEDYSGSLTLKNSASQPKNGCSC